MNDIFIVLWEPNQQQNPSYLSEAKSRAVRKRHEARAASKHNPTARRNGSKSSVNNLRKTTKVSKASAASRSQPAHCAKPKPGRTASTPFPPSSTASRDQKLIYEQPRLEEQPTSCYQANPGNFDIPSMLQQPGLGMDFSPQIPVMDVWQDLYPYNCDFNWFNPAIDGAYDGAMESLTDQDWAMVNRLHCSQMYLNGM